MEVRTLKQQLERKGMECQSLSMQVNRQTTDMGVVAQLQRDIEEMKVRVTRTEQDNESLRGQLAAQISKLQAK